MMKKALVIVSFGTSFVNIIETCIQPVEEAIASLYPDYDHYRAFTSRFIVRKLKEKHQMQVDLPMELLEKLAKEGYETVVLQPTHVLAGIEYHQLKEEILIFASQHASMQITFGQSLLYENEDYPKVVKALKESIPQPDIHEAVLLMGHGTEHFSNASYFALQYYLHAEMGDKAYIATVEAAPTLEDVIEALKAHQVNHVYLAPFMLVAGDHAHHDMAGEAEDSWVNVLARAGIRTTVILKGIGEYPAFRELYMKKARKTDIK